jgi:hypothetical protein
MTTYKDVLEYMSSESTEDECKALFDVANTRLRQLRSARVALLAVSIDEGAVVRIRNIRPKYLSGLSGTVTKKESLTKGVYVCIQLDEKSYDEYMFHARGCTNRVITGIPMSCIEVLA